MQFHVHIQIILNQHYTPAKPIVVNYARKITNSRVLNLNRFMWPYRKSQGALNSVDNFSGIFHSELKWWTDRQTDILSVKFKNGFIKISQYFMKHLWTSGLNYWEVNKSF